jgi:hypothetical protein
VSNLEPGAGICLQVGCCRGQGPADFVVFPLAELNAINEHTETLHLSPHITTDFLGHGVEKRPEVCTHSCEELSNMFRELSGLHVRVNQLSKTLERVVGAPWREWGVSQLNKVLQRVGCSAGEMEREILKGHPPPVSWAFRQLIVHWFETPLRSPPLRGGAGRPFGDAGLSHR